MKILIENTVQVYNKKGEKDEGNIMRIDLTITDITAEQLFILYSDNETRLKMDHAPKVLKTVEQLTKCSDITYSELHLPFPMSNREFLHKRLFVGNKESPDVIKEFGLYDWDHKYYVLIEESIERPDIPVKSSPVRAETKFSYNLIQEDPNDSGVVKIRTVSCTKMNGYIPTALFSSMGSQIAAHMIDGLKDGSKKIFGGGK